jgi:uncharacterized protein
MVVLVLALGVLTGSCSQAQDTSILRNEFVFPERQNTWINDFANIFSESEEFILDSLVKAHEKATTDEIIVVTIDSTWTTNENFDKFVLTLHNSWGIGKKGINNGVVIGISTGLRKIRISNGYGIEKRLSDEETKKVISQTITPEFKRKNYFEGTKKGILALISKLK